MVTEALLHVSLLDGSVAPIAAFGKVPLEEGAKVGIVIRIGPTFPVVDLGGVGFLGIGKLRKVGTVLAGALHPLLRNLITARAGPRLVDRGSRQVARPDARARQGAGIWLPSTVGADGGSIKTHDIEINTDSVPEFVCPWYAVRFADVTRRVRAEITVTLLRVGTPA